jgi:hypothetical protein
MPRRASTILTMLNEQTVPYKTWIKSAIVEALRRVFNNHVDKLLRQVKATIEFPHDRNQYPAIVVRFFERQISNAGVGHVEYLQIEGQTFKFRHRLYTGDVELAIYALSSLDRDLISDSLIQTLAMGDITDYTRPFLDRIYVSALDKPESEYNTVNLNTDQIMGYGESQTPAPWMSEDTLIYQSSYRFGVLGDFYNLPPNINKSLDFIRHVIQYPYIGALEPVPTGTPDDPSIWVPDGVELQQPGDNWDTAWPKR